MPDNYARRRFALPADWEPDTLWCVTLWIPGHVDYLDTLTGHLTDLGNSKNFERDATKTGAAIVARQWRRALDFEPPRIGNCAQPVNSPVLTTPEQKADYAAMIIYFMRTALLAPFVTCAGLSTSCSDCVDAVMLDLANYGGGPALRSALMNLCAAVHSAAPEEIAAAQSECPYIDEFNDLKDKVGNPYDWLNKLSEWLFNWLDSAASNLFNALNNAAGVIGGNGIQGWIDDHGGVTEGGGAGFGSDCPWLVELDLTSGAWYGEADPVDLTFGWTNVLGQWIDGVGWQASDGDRTPSPGERGRLAHILFTFPWSFTITEITVVYDLTKGAYADPDKHWQFQQIGFGSSYNAGIWNGDDPDGTDKEQTLTITATSDTVHVFLTAHHVSDGGALGGSCVAKKLIIHGSGPNPFV